MVVVADVADYKAMWLVLCGGDVIYQGGDTGDDPSYHHPSSPPLSPRQTCLKCHHIAGSSSGHPEKSCYLNTLNTLRNSHYTSGIVLLILSTMITIRSTNLFVTINMYLCDVRKCRLFQGMSLSMT